MKKLTFLVGGFIGIFQSGGVTWDYIQYVIGLKKLGHKVYYLEDTKLFPIYTENMNSWNDPTPLVNYIEQVMRDFDMDGMWVYRDEATSQVFGINKREWDLIVQTVDVFINISCSTVMRDEYHEIPVRILIDSDPMFTQIQYHTHQQFTSGKSNIKNLIRAHTHHYTFGENIYHTDCLIPVDDIKWKTTRQPILVDYWKGNSINSNVNNITTLMNWSAGNKMFFNGEYWGQKNEEFIKILNVPKQVADCNFSIVINQTGGLNDKLFPQQDILQNGWEILVPNSVSANWKDYQNFIFQSFAEVSIVKNTYTKANTGWFSCRSACYLASGKPVILQDTGWSKYLPTGVGLFAFNECQQAIEHIKQVLKDRSLHSQAARKICYEYFNSDIVLSNLINQL